MTSLCQSTSYAKQQVGVPATAIEGAETIFGRQWLGGEGVDPPTRLLFKLVTSKSSHTSAEAA